jgi:glycosyltransferase involved in cell wall biosynthesis
MIDISVVIPLYNEEESLPELCAWINKAMLIHQHSYEVILVDDGSKDNSWKVIEQLAAGNSAIKAIKFRRNYGKSAALNEGFKATMGQVVVTMDADLQDSPDEIHALYQMIMHDGNDLVSGWKKKRYDPISKTLPSKFFNYITRRMSGIHTLHDFNCGLKAYRKEVVKSIEVYGEMHRYIPVIAKWAGFNKIVEKPVEHRARKYGTTKFGLERFINGFLDLLSITFIARFGKRPMHIFGLLGTMVFLIGFFSAAYLGASKIYLVYKDIPARLITDRPSFYIALTCMILGTLLFLAGFLGELISRSAPDRDHYLIERKIKI